MVLQKSAEVAASQLPTQPITMTATMTTMMFHCSWSKSLTTATQTAVGWVQQQHLIMILILTRKSPRPTYFTKASECSLRKAVSRQSHHRHRRHRPVRRRRWRVRRRLRKAGRGNHSRGTGIREDTRGRRHRPHQSYLPETAAAAAALRVCWTIDPPPP